MAGNIYRLSRFILLGFVVIGVSLVYWQLVQAPFLVARDDNPRRVQAELRLRRGRLIDRNGEVLAYSEPVPETSVVEDAVRRRYPYSEVTHVVGYYSPRYGTGGAESTFDSVLRGTLNQIDLLLHRPQRGQDAVLSVDLRGQAIADELLAPYRGGIVVMDINTGEVLVLVSRPGYDANTLDDEWDALTTDSDTPLLNRVTQGLYPLGDLARWVGITGLLSSGATVPSDPLSGNLDQVLAPLSQRGYLATARQLEFDTVPLTDLPASEGIFPDFTATGTARDLAVTPLHMARLMAAVSTDGRMPVPSIGYLSHDVQYSRAFAPSVASSLRSLSPRSENVIGWSGTATPEETGDWPLSWFVGYAPAEDPQYAFALVVEDSDAGSNLMVPMAEKIVNSLDAGDAGNGQ